MIPNRFSNNTFTAWFLLIVLSLIWGSSFILMKKGLVDFSPEQVAGIRISSAFLFLLPVSIRNLSGIRKKDLGYLFASGLLGSLIPAVLFTLAETKIDSSIAGVLNGLTPLFTILVGSALFRLQITPRFLTGALIGFAGMVILILTGSQGNFWETNSFALLIVLATVLYGFNVNIVNSRLVEVKSSHITSFSMMLVGPIALGYLVINAGIPHILVSSHTAFYSLAASITLGVFGTAIAYILFNKMIKITNPVFSSSVTYLIPVIAVLWGLLDGEKLMVQHYVGIVFILAGVFIAKGKK